MNIIQLNKETMTVYEIAKLVEYMPTKSHRDAMNICETLLQDVDFTGGEIPPALQSVTYNAQGQTTQSYALNKRQSFALASRLNVSFLMRIVDRWQELENSKPIVEKTPLELLNEAVLIANEKEAQIRELTKRITALQIGGLQIVTELGSDLYFNVAAKILETNLGVKVGHNSLMEVLRAKGYLLMGTRSYYEKNIPAQKYTHLFRVILQRNHDTGVMSHTTVIRPEGLAHIAPLVVNWLTEHQAAKLQLTKGNI